MSPKQGKLIKSNSTLLSKYNKVVEAVSPEDTYLKRQREEEIHAETLRGIIQDREERKKYAKLIFWLVSGWLTIVLIIMFFIGFGLCKFTGSVIITLLGTTTANVATFLFIVAKYLFNPSISKK